MKVDRTILIRELRNATKWQSNGYGEQRRIKALIAYLETLSETGNFIMAEKSAKEFELL